jgi:urease gamma subunit
MARGLQLAEPPKRRNEAQKAKNPAIAEASPTLFAKKREEDKVQFNKRVDRAVADGYALLAIRTGKKVPELLKEGLEALEGRYGKA